MLTSSAFDRLDFELNNLFHELDQNSSDKTNTIMKNTKSNSYESNCERKYDDDVPHQDDNSFVFCDYLEDQFNSRVVENDDGPTEPQMQSDYIYYYNQDKQEGGVFKQTTKLHQKNAKMNSSSASFIVDSTGIVPSYEYSCTRTRKKWKKHKSEPGAHLSSTLNFPYKKAIQNIESNLSCSNAHQSGIWRDEGDNNAELLEKHFNSTWQFKFMRNFYCTDSSRATPSMMRSLEERTIEEEGKKCCDDKDMKHRGTTKETTRNDLKDSAPESVANISPSLISLVEDKRISIDDTLRKNATKRLFDAMESTDKSRDEVFRLEDEIGFNRTSV